MPNEKATIVFLTVELMKKRYSINEWTFRRIFRRKSES